MRVHFGSDHAAFELKGVLMEHVRSLGHEVVDHGPLEYDALDDYPVFVVPAAEAVREDAGSFGVVLGGSGNGEQIAANKVKGVRCALGHSVQTAQLAREHNNAQCLAIGARTSSVELAKEMVTVFLQTPFSGDERHERRLAMLESYESTGEKPQA
ncbi:ribose-5-phosphate isomerase [Dermatophilus congolensis]|uniref:Ribose-5-phosphate isomerase B n=1 Tax=Dermatophilus congolensis TaxID=1863 RepID=A0AA46BMH3_9MICO|nr:ribose-5-phosphate isomerase [Dermatophilus congolensis]MBO3142566.1 ribose-5-phosphate isomerase [Dermatophilus congolensis]MBO3151554.1 ribose-5-phosphate isomerase [Dermatophilus congolensis]MBO3161443.1 ribose-5-phosphate isomerase [Dermatophilus congolensis]MBO3162839.1 ribose-5-phosphate isomerase [Dermatophilus congolensis]MBO3176393.1 ribose-5-phosphate isomerase [Dermatophilus congolensis]